MTTKVKNTNWVDFPISIGVRMRLTAEQKEIIKEAYNQRLYAETQPDKQSTRGGLQVQTAYAAPRLIQEMGCDRYTLASLLASSERYSIAQLQKWEKALDIKLIDEKEIDAAWKSYKNHVFRVG